MDGITAVALALGSNLGDRERYLHEASAGLRAFVSNLAVSSFYDTAPDGVGGQPRFLNAVAVGATALSPRALLNAMLDLEARLGRTRPYPGAARTLDLDLIFYGDQMVEEPGLTVPHPRFRERRFVLEPLNEVAPEWVDPVSGLRVRELLSGLLP